MNFYPHHIGDYAQDTRHLTLIEHGAYRALLDLYYSREAPLPADVATVQRLACARAKDEREAVESVLREFFVSTTEGWMHKRCEREIDSARRKAEAARENGKKGGRRRPGGNPPGSDPPTHPKPGGNPVGSVQVVSGQAYPIANSQEPSSLALAAHAPAPEGRATAVDLAVAARQAGVQVTGSDPRLIEAAAQGVTAATLRDVIAECHRRKGSIPAIGYVLATLQGWATDAAGLRVVGAAPPGARGGVTDEQLAELQARLEAEERDAAA